MFKTTGRANPPTDVTVAWESSLDDQEWSDLAARVRPRLRFLAYGWWQAWGETMLPHGNWRGPLRFAVARNGGGMIQAVLPVAKQVMLGLPVLSLAGNYKPFRSWLIAGDAPKETAACLVDFITDDADAKAFRLGPVKRSQIEIEVLRRAFDDAGWRFCPVTRGENHLIDLPEDLTGYRKMVAPRKFQRTDYQRRRMGREGQVRIACHRGLGLDAWRQVIAESALVEQASWLLGQGGDLAYADPKSAAFWQRYLTSASASQAKSVWIIYVDDRPVSFNATLDSGDCRYGLSSHFDEAFKAYSPGKMVYLDAITDCFDRGVKVFSLGQGDGGFKAHYGANRVEPLADWLALPPTAAGRLLCLAARTKFGEEHTQKDEFEGPAAECSPHKSGAPPRH
ncbi:MAG: GNAT family N-acetyltransferase [Geminicoccaceae bacterium]